MTRPTGIRKAQRARGTRSSVIRLAHVWSSDMGISLSLPYCAPLLERGWEVFGISPPGPRLDAVREAGIRWLPHSLERSLGLRSDASGFLELVRCFREHEFHVVHTHNIKVGLVARVAAAAAGVPIIVHTHHGVMFSEQTPALRRRALAMLERIASLGADRILVQSEEDYGTIVACGAASRDQVELIGNGIDLGRFCPAAVSGAAVLETRRDLGVGPEDVLFFSAGRLVREKGFVELIEAANAARGRDHRIHLAIAGPVDTDKRDAIGPEVLARAASEGVVLLGERKDMVELYAAADVVVLASWREGIPRVLMEGAAMGKPLLATNVRGCREVLRPPMAGALSPVRDPAALASAMCALAADRPLRETARARNVAEAARRYDMGHVVERVERIYLELAAVKGLVPGGAVAPTARW